VGEDQEEAGYGKYQDTEEVSGIKTTHAYSTFQTASPTKRRPNKTEDDQLGGNPSGLTV